MHFDQRYIKRQYTLLAVGKKELGWDDDFYRDVFLVKHGATADKKGRISATTMNPTQLTRAVHAMRQAGFVTKPPHTANGSTDWRSPRIKKITAIWCALADAGVVHNRSEATMEKWCRGITKKAWLRWATAHDLNNCIEALKSWAAREHVELQH